MKKTDGRPDHVPIAQFRSEVIAEYSKRPVGPEALRAMGRALDVLSKTPGVATTADLVSSDLIARFLAAGGWTKPTSRIYYERRIHSARRIAVDLGYIPERLSNKIKENDKYDKYINDYVLSIEELKTAFNKISNHENSWTRHRVYAVASTVFYAGLNLAEALLIKVEDVDLPGRSIILIDRRHVLRPRQTRRVDVPGPLSAILADWLPQTASAWAFPYCERVRRQIRFDRPATRVPLVRDLRAAAAAADLPGFSFRSLRKLRERLHPQELPDFRPLVVPDAGPSTSHWAAGWVELRDRDDPPIVGGRSVDYLLSDKQHDLIQALLDAGPDGLTGDALKWKANAGGARTTFNYLKDKRPDLGAYMLHPSGGRGYRIGAPSN